MQSPDLVRSYPDKLRAILSHERTRMAMPGGSSKRVLENASTLIAETLSGVDRNELFYHLVDREKKGSTAIGCGVAIPHCRMENCPTMCGALLRLAEPIDFSARDNAPVDLLFVLLVPEEADEEHLRVLAMLAHLLGDQDFCRYLRDADSDLELYERMLRASTP